MKKLLVFAVAIAFSFATFAQGTPKKDEVKKDAPKKEVKKDAPKKEVKKEEKKEVKAEKKAAPADKK